MRVYKTGVWTLGSASHVDNMVKIVSSDSWICLPLTTMEYHLCEKPVAVHDKPCRAKAEFVGSITGEKLRAQTPKRLKFH